MRSYLDNSIKKLYTKYVNPDNKWTNDSEYIFLRSKTLDLYNTYNNLDKKGLHNRILCLAASFWIVSKLYDDYHYENDQIIEGFDLDKFNTLTTDLNSWEVKVLKSRNWELDYLPELDITLE